MIYEMTATFGKLDGQTLKFSEGLNVITAPNEWGKSTWCAFLVAMFYGIDSRERSGRENLADKEHYQPWSGKPMEGRIRLIHKGRDITIQRSARGRIPFGQFRAYETQSGLVIPELTAENCAQELLGVEKSVFIRSGFIRLKDMPVGQDEALRRRLNALVTTADESGISDRLAGQLRELRNRCLYHRSGLIPEERSWLADYERKLELRRELEQQLRQAERQEMELLKRQQLLELHEQWLAYWKNQDSHRKLENLRAKYHQIQHRTAVLEERCRTYPQMQTIQEQLHEGYHPRKEKKAPRVKLWFATFAMLMLIGAALAVAEYYIPGAVLAVLGIGCCVGGIAAAGRKKVFLQEEQQEQQHAEQCRELLEQLSQLQELERCRAEQEQTEEHLVMLESMVQQVERPSEQNRLTYDPEQTRREEQTVDASLRRSRIAIGQSRGKLEELPEEGKLRQMIAQSQQRLRKLEQTYEALGYAQKALEQAMEELQRRFAPRITRRTQELFSAMTGGRYDQISIAEDLAVTAAARDEVVQRTSLWRSDGTADQLYLALRLAVAEELMPEGIIVLDDALVRFDDGRLADAIRILKEIGKQHQVILFSCHEREKLLAEEA